MESSENNKLFVGGVSRETTEGTLRQHFSKFGQVEESLIIRDRLTGISRGFGFVEFTNSSMANEALRVQHFILGRTVDVRPAQKKGNRQEHSNLNGSNGSVDTQSSKKIFVGGLPHNLTEQEFKNYFEKFGTVTDAVVIFDKETHKPRGFGFITFDSEAAVNIVLQNCYYNLKNTKVEVKRAQPKDRNENEKYMNYYDCYSTGLAFGYSPPVPYNAYPTFQPHGYYGSWTSYAFGPSTGGWVPSVAVPSSSSSHGHLASGNPSFHNLVSYPPYFGGSGVYMNGWPSETMDWTSPHGNLIRNGDSGTDNSNMNNNIGSGNSNKDADGSKGNSDIDDDGSKGNANKNDDGRKGNSNREYDNHDSRNSNGEVEVPRSARLPHGVNSLNLKNSESSLSEHRKRVIDDSSGSTYSGDEHQMGEIADSSSLKKSAEELLREKIDDSSCSSSAEHQKGETDDSSVQK